jgi:hypothetical protein
MSVWSEEDTASHVWDDKGVYYVSAQASNAGNNLNHSTWSESLTVIVDSAHVVTKPDPPDCPDTVCVGDTYTCCTGGSISNYGSPIEYMISWGDGDSSGWSLESCASHVWTKTGTYDLWAAARAADDTTVSDTSDVVSIEVVGCEIPTPPSRPSGRDDGCPGEVYEYRTGGSICAGGEEVEYQLVWGDGSSSGWGDGRETHQWDLDGEYEVKAYARCVDSHGVSDPSPVRVVTIGLETVSSPYPPEADTLLCPGEAELFQTGGAASSCGHDVEYQFDWGDGTQSTWGPPYAFHQYQVEGTYNMKARARCETHTEVQSAWSGYLTVRVEEVVSRPSTPNGPPSVCENEAETYCTGGATNNCGYAVEYQFDWGDGTVSPWTTNLCVSHAWDEDGTYLVKAQARSTHNTNKISPWSTAMTVTVGAETISKPDTPTGENNPCPGDTDIYSTGGAESSCGHDVEYRFAWGDGSFSSWSTGTIEQHNWAENGTFEVKAQARCREHTSKESEWSDPLSVYVHETITTPATPMGPNVVCLGETGQFCTEEATSSCGHEVEYQFDWGDGSKSNWTSSLCVQREWTMADTFYVKVHARCEEHTDKISDWSQSLQVVVSEEAISAPSKPEGDSLICPDEAESYETGGAVSTCGHQVQYQFDWGDGGEFSDWDVSLDASHAWAEFDTFEVRARARCATHTSRISGWSEAMLVVVDETVPVPSAPAGRDTICPNEAKTYEVEPVETSCGHTVEYRFSWGDGTTSDWDPATDQSHTWTSVGDYPVKVRARCSIHTEKTTDWSDTLWITVGNETVTTPLQPEGDVEVCPEVDATYTAVGAYSSCGHSLEYQFHWGDGDSTEWQLSASASHAWDLASVYPVKVRARCAAHTSIDTEWSDTLLVDVDEKITRPGAPAGPLFVCTGAEAEYSVDEATSSCGHSVEYTFEWGDGDTSPWGSSTSASHSWSAPGDYDVTVRARCEDHTWAFSALSETTQVEVTDQGVFLLISWESDGSLNITGNYPPEHLPLWSATHVTYDRPAWCDCGAPSSVSAIFAPDYDPPENPISAYGRLFEMGQSGIYVDDATESINLTLWADFKSDSAQARYIEVNLGACTEGFDGTQACSGYMHEFERGDPDDCFPGQNYVRLELIVPAEAPLPPDPYDEVAVWEIRIDFEGWCGSYPIP